MSRRVLHRLPIGWAGQLALQRLLAQWRSLLTLVAGVLLSCTVGALVPLYTTAVAQVGMVERFNNQLPIEQSHTAANVSLVASENPDFAATIKDFDAQFRSLADQKLTQPFPNWLNRVVLFGETSALDITPTGSDPSEQTARVFVSYYEGWPETVNLVAGKLPTESIIADVDIEVVVPFEAQRTLGVNIGQTLLLDQGGARGGWPSSKRVRARVVGVAATPDNMTALQRAYFMPPSPLRLERPGGEYTGEYPVLTTRASFERVASAFVPDTPTRIGWRLLFDHRRLPFSRSPEARQSLFDFERALQESFSRRVKSDLQFNYRTHLIKWEIRGGQNVDQGILLDYERSVRSLNAPFGLLLLQLGALVIFFLLVTASLVRRGERREIAMLQSRGAFSQQIVAVRGAEALIICVVSILIAPVLAQQMLIAATPFFANYAGLPLNLTPETFLYAGVAAAAAFITLLFTLRAPLNQPLITSGGATQRSDSVAWWQRYYVDVLLMVMGLLALVRLVGTETPIFTTIGGQRTTDPFLLMAPALLFLGLGSILLRLFPVIAAVAARAQNAGRGLIGSLAAWQLSREPIHYGRITFLLSLAIGIGWFATSFRATVARSQSDQAQYHVGTDIRFNERDLTLNAARARAVTTYAQSPGVDAVSTAWRQLAVNFQRDPSKDPIFAEVLGVDADSFPAVTRWRDDLGPINLPRPAGQPISLPERGSEMPFVPQKINLWAEFTLPDGIGGRTPDLERLRDRTRIFARLLDSNGTWVQVPFRVIEVEQTGTGPQAPGLGGGGTFGSTGWAYLEGDLSALAYKPAGPLRFVSLYWRHRGRNLQGERDLWLTFAGLTARNEHGASQSLDLFRTAGWQFEYDTGATGEGRVSVGVADGRRGSAITAIWDQNSELATLGALLNYPDLPSVPLLASDGLLERLNVQSGQTIRVIGLEGRTVSFRITGQQSYYPTLYDAYKRDGKLISDDRNHPFAVVDREALLYTLNRRPSAALYADEVWIKTQPGADSNSILQTLRPAQTNLALINVLTRSGELATLQTDPLSVGLLGLMFLAFLVALALSVVGLLTYAALTAVGRRTEFGVLRALGLSSAHLIRQLALEQFFVIALGVGLGAVLGAVLSSQVVPRLAQDTSTRSITPPFVVQIETAALLQYGLVIALVLGLVLLSALLLVRQLSLSQTLRLGEE